VARAAPVLVEGLGAGERDRGEERDRRTWELGDGGLCNGLLAVRDRRALFWCAVGGVRGQHSESEIDGRVHPELVELGGHAGTDGVVQLCYSPRAV
jgi:hypothetical protein